MAIEVVCDHCYASYKVKHDRAGTRIRCKECDELIEVPDAAESSERSRATPPRRGGKPAGRRKSQQDSSVNVGLFVGIGAAGLVGIALLLVVARFLMQPAPVVQPQQAPQLADGNQPAPSLPGVAAPAGPAPGSSAPEAATPVAAAPDREHGDPRDRH